MQEKLPTIALHMQKQIKQIACNHPVASGSLFCQKVIDNAGRPFVLERVGNYMVDCKRQNGLILSLFMQVFGLGCNMRRVALHT